MLRLLFVLALSFAVNSAAQCQTATDSPLLKHSPIRTLSDQQYNAYLTGNDINSMALVAELNHYPAPERVLIFKKQLELSPIQAEKIGKIATELHRKKVEMGAIVIHNERTLDSLFRTRKLYDGVIIFYANRYGLYQGELRNAILQACFNTEKLLTAGQIKKLEALQKSN